MLAMTAEEDEARSAQRKALQEGGDPQQTEDSVVLEPGMPYQAVADVLDPDGDTLTFR